MEKTRDKGSSLIKTYLEILGRRQKAKTNTNEVEMVLKTNGWLN
jgi:hypothetical protein